MRYPIGSLSALAVAGALTIAVPASASAAGQCTTTQKTTPAVTRTVHHAAVTRKVLLAAAVNTPGSPAMYSQVAFTQDPNTPPAGDGWALDDQSFFHDAVTYTRYEWMRTVVDQAGQPAVHHDAVTHQESRYDQVIKHSHEEFKWSKVVPGLHHGAITHAEYRWSVLSRSDLYRWSILTRQLVPESTHIVHHDAVGDPTIANPAYKAPWNETVTVKDAWDETVVDKAAWDEQVPATYKTVHHDAITHTEWRYSGHGSSGSKWIDNDTYKYIDSSGHGTNSKPRQGTYYERTSKTRTVVDKAAWDEQVVDAPAHTVHHDAITHTVHHDAVTRVVHHHAVGDPTIPNPDYVPASDETVTVPAHYTGWKWSGYTEWGTASQHPAATDTVSYGSKYHKFSDWQWTRYTDWQRSTSPPALTGNLTSYVHGYEDKPEYTRTVTDQPAYDDPDTTVYYNGKPDGASSLADAAWVRYEPSGGWSQTDERTVADPDEVVFYTGQPGGSHDIADAAWVRYVPTGWPNVADTRTVTDAAAYDDPAVPEVSHLEFAYIDGDGVPDGDGWWRSGQTWTITEAAAYTDYGWLRTIPGPLSDTDAAEGYYWLVSDAVDPVSDPEVDGTELVRPASDTTAVLIPAKTTQVRNCVDDAVKHMAVPPSSVVDGPKHRAGTHKAAAGTDAGAEEAQAAPKAAASVLPNTGGPNEAIAGLGATLLSAGGALSLVASRRRRRA